MGGGKDRQMDICSTHVPMFLDETCTNHVPTMQLVVGLLWNMLHL